MDTNITLALIFLGPEAFLLRFLFALIAETAGRHARIGAPNPKILRAGAPRKSEDFASSNVIEMAARAKQTRAAGG